MAVGCKEKLLLVNFGMASQVHTFVLASTMLWTFIAKKTTTLFYIRIIYLLLFFF